MKKINEETPEIHPEKALIPDVTFRSKNCSTTNVLNNWKKRNETPLIHVRLFILVIYKFMILVLI